jgi:hypothetical protein
MTCSWEISHLVIHPEGSAIRSATAGKTSFLPPHHEVFPAEPEVFPVITGHMVRFIRRQPEVYPAGGGCDYEVYPAGSARDSNSHLSVPVLRRNRRWGALENTDFARWVNPPPLQIGPFEAKIRGD